MWKQATKRRAQAAARAGARDARVPQNAHTGAYVGFRCRGGSCDPLTSSKHAHGSAPARGTATRATSHRTENRVQLDAASAVFVRVCCSRLPSSSAPAVHHKASKNTHRQLVCVCRARRRAAPQRATTPTAALHGQVEVVHSSSTNTMPLAKALLGRRWRDASSDSAAGRFLDGNLSVSPFAVEESSR